MCLNASLAGLVAITAPCDVTDCFGAICIGFVSGLLVCFGVWLLDYKLHVDDPVAGILCGKRDPCAGGDTTPYNRYGLLGKP